MNTLSPATILHFDSSYRNVSDWPHPGEFEVPVEGNSNYINSQLNSINSGYPVAGSSVSFYHKWGSNAFNLYSVANPRQDPTWSATDGATLSLSTTSTSLKNSDGNYRLIFDISAADHPQMLQNYYRGVDITATIGGDDYHGVVDKYMYSGDKTCAFTIVGFAFTQSIPEGTVFTLSDPTDTGIDRIFLPGGDQWDNAYTHQYIIFNDTLNEWRPIKDYDGAKCLIQVYTASDPLMPGQAGDSVDSGLIADWRNNHTYSIRNPNGSPPFINSNGGAALTDPSPTDTTNNTALWFEPKQALTSSSFNLGVAANVSIVPGSFIELMYNPGGLTVQSNVNYQDTLTGGSTSTATLTVGPNSLWTQDDYYKGLSMVVDTVAVGQLLTITTNTGVSANFVAAAHTVAVGTNNTYTGTGTGMTFTLTVQATNNNDVVSAAIISAGSGYIANETITISEAQMRLITGTGTITITTPVVLTITAAAATGDSQGLVRLVTGYNSATKTVRLNTILPSALQSGDTVSFHPYANKSVVPTIKNYQKWRSKLVESNQVQRFINEHGEFANILTAGTTFLTFSGQNKENNAYARIWISWIQNGGCYARLISSSTYDSATQQTTANFERPLGGTVSGVPTITTAGTVYNAPSTVQTTLSSASPMGGSGLTINITSVDNSAIGQPLTVTTNTGVTANFTAASFTMTTLVANSTYTGAGTGMTLTLTNSATNNDDVVSAVVLAKGSGYLNGETITINQAQMITITGIGTLTLTDTVVLTLTVAATTGAVTAVTVNDAGNHYSIGDVVTLVGGGGDATLTIGALTDIAAGTGWSICSGTTSGAFSSYFNMQQWLYKTFIRNDATNLSLNTSNVSLQGQVCYEVDLVSLTLPNAPLGVGRSGRLAFYPYVLVELSSPGSASGASRNLIMSNNPNAKSATFVAPIDDTSGRDTATFIKVDADGASQVMKFNPNTNLLFRVTLPGGEVLRFNGIDGIIDETPPAPPNILGQISAVFSLRRVC